MMHRATIAAAALGLLAAFLAGEPVEAGEIAPTGWVEGHGARVRLVPGPLLATGEQIVGVHIALDDGWHTYWRNPGDSGAPPVFDWSASGNVASATTEYPAPQSLPDPWGVSIGYLGEVVFPVAVTPADPAEPLDLVLGLDYAACREICVPQSATLARAIEPGDTPAPDAIALVNAFRALVPHPQESPADGSPRIDGAHAGQRGDQVVLTVEAHGEGPAQLFVEGPPAYYFAVPEGVPERPDGAMTFTVEVDGADDPAELAGARLTATLVSADGAVEYSWLVE